MPARGSRCDWPRPAPDGSGVPREVSRRAPAAIECTPHMIPWLVEPVPAPLHVQRRTSEGPGAVCGELGPWPPTVAAESSTSCGCPLNHAGATTALLGARKLEAAIMQNRRSRKEAKCFVVPGSPRRTGLGGSGIDSGICGTSAWCEPSAWFDLQWILTCEFKGLRTPLLTNPEWM